MIIVSLTTIPSRMSLLPKCLDSIKSQTIQPDIVYLQVPKISRKGVLYDLNGLREIVKSYKFVKINILERDLGPITKLYPLLSLTKNLDDVLILVDDDVEYSPNIIKNLLKNENLNACGFVGLSSNLSYIKSSDNPISVSFLETYHGVLYKRSLFSDDFLDFYLKMIHQEASCLSTDDIVIGAYLRYKNYKLWVIDSSDSQVRHDAKDTEELRNINLNGGNRRCFYSSENNYTILIIILLLVLLYLLSRNLQF